MAYHPKELHGLELVSLYLWVVRDKIWQALFWLEYARILRKRPYRYPWREECDLSRLTR